MNNIAYFAAGAASADGTRARMRRAGCTPNGERLWTDAELQTLRRLYPDYRAAMQAVGRTYFAIRAKAQQLGLSPKRRHWTGDQVLRLRKLYRSATTTEIEAAFPDRSRNNIYKMARYFGMRRPPKPYTPTGFLVIDQIRARCFELRLSMVDLDTMAHTGTYFSKAGWYNGGVNARAVGKAIHALDGQLGAVWNEPDVQKNGLRLVA